MVKRSTHATANSCQIPEAFDADGLTAVAGANLLVDFARQHLDLPDRLNDLSVEKAAWAASTVAQDIEYLMTGYALGAKRILHFDDLENDPLLQTKLGFEGLPQHSTLYRTVERFDSKEKVAPLGRVNRDLLEHLVGDEVIVDIDTTVETVHGSQEGASIAYNPRHRGRASYQPIIAFDGITRAAIHVELRSGRPPNAEEKISFYKAAKDQLPKATRVKYVRADRGFPSDAFCEVLENDGVGYALKLRMSEELYRRIYRGVKWDPVPSDPTVRIQVGSVGFRYKSWDRHRRVVLIRTQPAEDAQGKLFPEYAWEYQAILTNLDWHPEDIWHFYNQRATCENHIKELKCGLHIDAISKAGFWPNAADLWIKTIAYNMLLALRGLADETYRHYGIERFRRALLRVPGILVRHARQLKLRLPSYWPHQAAWRNLRAALSSC